MSLYALVVSGVVQAVEPNRDFWPNDLFDVRDVSDVAGIGAGWTVDAKGKFSAPKTAALAIPDISRAQAKIQLLRTPGSSSTKSLLDDATAAVNAAGGEIAIWFADAATWQRKNPYIAQIGTALGLSDAQIDELFLAAAAIQA